MKETPFSLDFDDDHDDSLTIKDTIVKYMRYWPWFLVAAILALVLGYLYTQVTPLTYRTVAKIKIMDDTKDLNVATDALALMGKSSINLENEVEVLKSYRLLSQVVNDLKLDIEVYKTGSFIPSRVWQPPFAFTKQPELDTLQVALAYTVVVNGPNFLIADEDGR